MSGENDFLSSELQEIEETIQLIEDLTEKNKLTPYEVIAMGKLLQDVYNGYRTYPAFPIR